MSGHYLIVQPLEPDADVEWHVEHPQGCPAVNHGDKENPVLVENCGVGFHIDQYGIAEFFLHEDDEDAADPYDTRERVSVGRHAIESWQQTHRGFDYIEYSAGVRLVDGGTS